MLSVLLLSVLGFQSCQTSTCQPAGYAVQAVSPQQFTVPGVVSAPTQFTQNACSGMKAKKHHKFKIKLFKCQ